MAKDQSQGAPTREAIRVFISYSRADHVFATDLLAGLEACGFEAYIDKEDIAPGEPWQDRLRGLIEAADTVVFVISPDSVNSEHCTWEVRETLALSKRLLPVVWRDIPDDQLPPTLAALNFTFFNEGTSFPASLRTLASALRIDVDWIREHTRLGALARRWDTRGRTDALLLRGDELEAAKTWAGRRPQEAPDLNDLQVDFIAASDTAEQAAERAARNRRRALVTGLSFVAIALAGLSALAGWAWYRASGALTALEASTTQLRAANLRLSADIGLKSPPSDAALSVKAGWFPVAAEFSGAVVRVEALSDSGRKQVTSGYVLDGAVVHPDFAGESLVLAPETLPETALPDFPKVAVLGSDDAPRRMEQRYVSRVPEGLAEEAIAERGGEMVAGFPALISEGGEAPDVPLDIEPVWTTPMHLGAMTRFAVYRIKAPLPFGARAIGQDDVDCRFAPGLDISLFPPEDRPVALFGIDEHGTGTLTLEVTGLTETSDPFSIAYRHTPMPGTFGAPVFSLSSGKVIASHVEASSLDGGPLREGTRVRGGGFSLGLLLNEIRDEVSIELGGERTPPICDIG